MIRKMKARGYLYSIGIVFNRVVPESLFRFRVFHVFELGTDSSDHPQETDGGDGAENLPTSNDGIQFRWCQSQEDIDAAIRLTHFRPIDPGGIKIADLNNTLRACLALDGNTPVGGLWLSNGSFLERELGLVIELQPDTSWLFAAYVEKSHRRQGIYRRLLAFALATNEINRVFASINLFNNASMAAHRCMIVQKLGSCWAVRMLGLSVCHGNDRLLTKQAIGSRTRVELHGRVQQQR